MIKLYRKFMRVALAETQGPTLRGRLEARVAAADRRERRRRNVALIFVLGPFVAMLGLIGVVIWLLQQR